MKYDYWHARTLRASMFVYPKRCAFSNSLKWAFCLNDDFNRTTLCFIRLLVVLHSYCTCKCVKDELSREHLNAARDHQGCREEEEEEEGEGEGEEEVEADRGEAWRRSLISKAADWGKHLDFPRSWKDDWKPREDRMEEKKQFLCGVVEGESGRLHNWPPWRSCDLSFSFFFS